jgi:hypothetical protein
MSQEMEALRSSAQQAGAMLAEQVFMYRPEVFEGSISFADELPRELPDIPTITRNGRSVHLTLSLSGARVWANAVGDGCDTIGVSSDFMYASCGIAMLELANVLNYSTRANDPVARLRKVEKAFRDDLTPQTIGCVISEYSGVNLMSIIAGLDQDDSTTISKIRYGIGVALKGLGADDKAKREFVETNIDEAILALRNYRESVVRYLADAIFLDEIDVVDTSSSEVTASVNNADFPFLRIAACLPMNVEYLLNR